MSLIHNERVKLSATLLNGTAIACVAVGGIAPIVGLLIEGRQAAVLAVAVGFVIWLLVAGLLHFAARALLGKQRE